MDLASLSLKTHGGLGYFALKHRQDGSLIFRNALEGQEHWEQSGQPAIHSGLKEN
jgi:predicted transcriptional regulator